MRVKPTSGFVPAVLSHSISSKPPFYKGMGKADTGKITGIFLLSRKEEKPKRKPNKTNNRKHISYSDEFSYKGVSYKVNSKPTGIYTDMLKKAINQLDTAKSIWGRVLMIRFDLHQHEYSENSQKISWLFKNLTRRLKKQYELKEVGYFWVREHERAKAQHYHCWVFLDGRKVKHSSKVISIAKEVWVKNWAGHHHIPTTKKPFRKIENDESFSEAIYMISYGCKGRGKGYRPPQSKDYGTSRLKRYF